MLYNIHVGTSSKSIIFAMSQPSRRLTEYQINGIKSTLIVVAVEFALYGKTVAFIASGCIDPFVQGFTLRRPLLRFNSLCEFKS